MKHLPTSHASDRPLGNSSAFAALANRVVWVYEESPTHDSHSHGGKAVRPKQTLV